MKIDVDWIKTPEREYTVEEVAEAIKTEFRAKVKYSEEGDYSIARMTLNTPIHLSAGDSLDMTFRLTTKQPYVTIRTLQLHMWEKET